MLQLEFGPGHQAWQYLERGVQIVVGVSAISTVTFLGEVWGNEDVPYDAVFIALWWLGYGFLVALAPTPLAWALVPFLGPPTPQRPTRRRVLQIWAVFSLITPLVVALWMFIYAAEFMLFKLALSQGVDYSTIDLYQPDPDDDGETGLFGGGIR